MDTEKIENVLSENLGEGYRIVHENNELSAVIEWVDWVQQSDDEDDILVEVQFDDDSKSIFKKGIHLRQIWHEDVQQ